VSPLVSPAGLAKTLKALVWGLLRAENTIDHEISKAKVISENSGDFEKNLSTEISDLFLERKKQLNCETI
jgi:hypothetical protein